jgi:ribosomal protein S1
MSEKRVRRPDSIVKEGDVLKVRIKSVDVGQRRISLSLRQLGGEETEKSPPDTQAPALAQPKRRRRPLKGGLDR